MTDNLRQSSHPIDFGRGGAQIDMTSAIDIEGGLRARYRQPAGVEQFGIEAVPEELKTAGWFDLFSIMFNLSMCMLAGRRWWAWSRPRGEQPHAKQIARAPQPTMRSPDKEREPVPVASDAERPWRSATIFRGTPVS
jgi:ABC-type sugar transport system ATPase subunit